MFHRRLLLLMGAVVAVTVVLGAATARLTLGAEHLDRLHRAERALVETDVIPTVRGRILDRHGRVLAIDEPAFALTVDYDVIAGDWAYGEALNAAERKHRATWGELSSLERKALVNQELPRFEQQAEMFWQLVGDIGGVERAEIEQRRAEVVRRVARVAAGVANRKYRNMVLEMAEPVNWADAVTPVQEQHWKHAILTDLDDAQRLTIQNFQAEGERQALDARNARLAGHDGAADGSPMAIWTQTELLRPKQRRYPNETRTVAVETDDLPKPLAEKFKGEPVDVTVQGVALHLVGMMRKVWAEDEQRRPYVQTDEEGRSVGYDVKGYLPGDHIGSFGAERSFEDRLRGGRGRERFHLDTGEREIVQPPIPGEDVQLSIDVQLQAHVQAIMSPEVGLMVRQPWHVKDPVESEMGEPLTGAAVVMEVATGDVLAAVSMPGMPLEAVRNRPQEIFGNHIDAPYRNRVVAQSFEPGSTIKPLVGAAVVSDGKLGPDEEIFIRGYLWEGKPNVYRDWYFKATLSPFGPGDLVFALMRSSNVFFGEMVQRLGKERTVWWFKQFGLGSSTGSGLEGESAGILELPDGGWEYMAIGEAGVEWTPLQAAAAYAAIARGGDYLPPRLVLDGAPAPTRHLPLSSVAVDRVLEGMHGSANNTLGTTHHLSKVGRQPIFNAKGVDVVAKSGTAQAAPLREVAEYDAQGYPLVWGNVVRDGDHAWVIAMVKPEGAPRPTHVIAVIAEYAGSGGQVSGPIVNAIIHALQAEGYL